jgi:predicted RNase H-like nuclease
VPVLGVDGWRGAWVGALLEGRSVRLLALPDVAAVLAVPGVEVVAVDMPIGLSDDGARACDRRAKALLGRAGSSVFPAPVRAVLGARDYADARRISVRATGGTSLSAQAFQLVGSIRALDDALGDPPLDHVVEVHPELAFRALDPAVADPKATARGTAQRLAALRPVMDVDAALLAAPPRVPAVDALDACAAAWSARRIADGGAECVGDGSRDARGRPVRICF